MAEKPGRGHGKTDGDGVEVGRRVPLPKGAQEPIRVYINGVEQDNGEDYSFDGDGILFHEPIVKEGKLPRWRWLTMYVGLFGSYNKHETVDVEYRIDGRVHLASDLEVVGD